MEVTAQIMEESLVEMEKEITCAICHCRYKDPKVLPCCHFYCKDCILKPAGAADLLKPFSCPECRAECKIPQTGVDDLPTAFFINRMKEKFARLEQAFGKVESLCELCCEGKPDAFCHQCGKFLCSNCEESHQRMKALFPNHKTTPLAELKLHEAKQMFDRQVCLKNCDAHDEPLKVFCFDCKCLICRDCTVRDHNGHNCEFNKIAAPMARNELTEKMKPLQETRAEISESLKELQKLQSELSEQEIDLSQSIKGSFEELHQILERREKELLEDLAKRVKEKKAKLSSQEENLSISNTVIQNVFDYANQCIKLSPDDEVMSMHAEILQQISKEVERHVGRKSELEPVEEVDLGAEVKCSKMLQTLCITNTSVFQLPITCTLNCDSATLHQESEVIFLVKLSDGSPKKKSVKFLCHLRPTADDAAVKCDVCSLGSDKYSIKFTPTVRGRHELEVSVTGRDLTCSKFPIFVTYPATQHGKPVQVWDGLSKPTDITINSQEQIIVTEQTGDVLIFNRNGNKIKKLQHNFKNLSGVAANDHSLYLTNSDDNCIHEYHMTTDQIEMHEVDQIQGPGHWTICALKDRVVTCERHKFYRGGLVIYDLLFNRLHQIDGKFTAVHTTEHRIFATSYALTMNVYDKNGVSFKSFNCNTGYKSMFSFTAGGLCITNQRIYIANKKNNSIIIFNSDGIKLASFGKEGSGKGNFNNPRAMTIDKDGFLYICDSSNGRIQVL